MHRQARISNYLLALLSALLFTWNTALFAFDNSLAFNSNDRLSVTNLIASYGYSYDEGHIDDYRSLFTESALVYGVAPDGESVTISQLIEFSAPRLAHFKKNGIQRRHVLSPVRFEAQSEDEATGQVYMQLYSIKNEEKPEIILTGFYSFKAVRTTQGWKIDRWQIHADSKID